MPDALTLATAITPQLPAPEAPKPKNAAEAARQFEAILIAQMLRNARSGTTLSGGEEDSTAETTWDMAAQQFSKLLADKGGLGLATLITKGLDQRK